MRRAGLGAGALILAAAAIAEAQLPAALARQFTYDPTAPLDIRDSVLETGDGVALHALTYLSPKGGRVTALLVRPIAPGRHAAVLFGHWGYGTKVEFLPEARLYARAGVVSLLVDYPWVRPDPWRRNEGPLEQPEVDRDVHVQAVVDLRRGLDLLLSRGDVDPARVAYIGHSYGAQWGAILSAVEARLAAVVLMAGVPDDRAILLESQDPGMVAYRARWTREQLDRYLAVNDSLAAVWFVPHARLPLLMQFARLEPIFGLPAMRRYLAAAPEPKTVRWYDTGHELNDPGALIDRARWLASQLGLTKMDAELRRLVTAP